MWILYAFASALFAGVTSILAKIGIKDIDSNLATAIRTVVIMVFSWLMVFIVGSAQTITDISAKTLIFLILSGLATGGSWLCYFKALQLGNVNQVAPIDKSSVILTILLAFILLDEPVGAIKLTAIAAIGIGTFAMLEKKQMEKRTDSQRGWLFYAVLSAIFASLTAILGKIGIDGIESNLGAAIRTIVVLIMAWLVVFISHKQNEIRHINRTNWIFICLSGITTGLSWLCYYKALKDGLASVVVPIDKLSIVVTVMFSYLFLKERLQLKAWIGLLLILGGTLLLAFS